MYVSLFPLHWEVTRLLYFIKIVFGFFAIIYGWPALGAIGKTKETTLSTIISIVVYIGLLFGLVVTNSFTLIHVAIVRSITEFILFATRYFFFKKYKYLFHKTV